MAFQATLVSTNAFAVTPSDTTVIDAVCFYVGSTGDVAVMPKWQEGVAARGGTPTPVTYKAVPAGVEIWLNICRVMETNTTASEIVCKSSI